MSKRKRSRAGKLVLEQLDIPGKTGPVSDSPPVWGINIAAALGNFPRQGLLCRAGPWTPMTQGDLVKVDWPKGVEVLQKVVGPGEENMTLQMFIPSLQIDEGLVEASYSVKRVGQAWEPSEDIRVLVKLTRPGGHDDNADPGHSKLIFSIPPDIINGGIDKDNIAAGVPITIERYPNIAVGDLIQVTWGGQFVLSNPLTQDQVDGKVPIVVHVSEAVIREAGDSDGRGVDVAFEVYDIVENRSEDWSAPQWVVVAADATRILAPMLKEALNNILDLVKLGDRPGNAQIWAIPPEFEVGDAVKLIIKGTPLEGPPISIEISGKPLQNVPSTDEIEIPNALLRQFAKTQLAMRYRLIKANGNPDLHSKTQFIRVEGEPQQLAPPIALDAVQGALDPELTTVRIGIPWDDSFAAGQAIKTIWLGTAADLTTYMPTLTPRLITNGDVEAKEPLEIPVEGKHLTPIIGGILELYYLLLIDDSVLGTMNCVNATHAVRESEHADILRVGEPRLELPEPEVAGVVDGALPADTDGTTLTVNYLKTAKGDVVIYEWVGSKTGTATDSVKLTSFTAGQPVPFAIKVELIKANEGGTVSASYSIEREAGGTSYSNPLVFRIGAALENPLPVAHLPQATGSGANVTLAPLDAKTGVKVVVHYSGMKASHFIQLTMTGKPDVGSPPIAGKPGLDSGSVEFLIPPEALAANIGNAATTFTLNYEVTQGSLKIPSLSLTVTVTPLPASELDKLSILQAVGDELDISKLTAGATVSAGVWAFIMAGQPVWLVLMGTNAQGEQHNLVVWKVPGAAVNAGWISAGKFNQGVFYDYFKELADGSDLELHFKAALTSSQVEADAIVAPVKIYRIKAVADVKPVIASVIDSKGIAIPQDGLTVDTNITLSGTAAPNREIEIYHNGETTGGRAPVDAQGKWIQALVGVPQGAFDLKCVARYGSNLESTEWKIVVTPMVIPSITSIKDSKGVEIPAGGTTVETSVTLTGIASKGQKVDVRDGEVSKGKAPVDPTTGVWTLVVPGLIAALYSFTAKAEYGAGTVSAPRTLTVANALVPVITSVKDSKGVEISQNGTTADTSVTITGTATPNREVEIFDGAQSKGMHQINPQGVWIYNGSKLIFGTHDFRARAMYGNGAESTNRIFTIISNQYEDFESRPLGFQNGNIDLPTMTIKTTGSNFIINEANTAPYITGKALRLGEGSEHRGDIHLKSSATYVKFGFMMGTTGYTLITAYDANGYKIHDKTIWPSSAQWIEISAYSISRIYVSVTGTRCYLDNFSISYTSSN